MKITESLKERRSFYDIDKKINVSEKQIIDFVKEATELVPDAFNMKSSRVLIVTKQKHDLLWDKIYEVFDGKVPKDKIDIFKKGYGTILFFIDRNVVTDLEENFPLYAPRFMQWATQSAGMLELSVWSGLKELDLGASLQHYNPIIDDMVKQLFNIPDSFELNAQMPFGGIVSNPQDKESEDINKRVLVF